MTSHRTTGCSASRRLTTSTRQGRVQLQIAERRAATFPLLRHPSAPARLFAGAFGPRRRARARSLLTPSQSASRLLNRAAPPRRSAWQSAVAPPSTTPRPLSSAGRAPRASRRRRASACRCAGICAIERRFAAPSKRGAPRGNAAACSGGRGHSPPPRSGLGVIGTGRGRGEHACAAPFSSRARGRLAAAGLVDGAFPTWLLFICFLLAHRARLYAIKCARSDG